MAHHGWVDGCWACRLVGAGVTSMVGCLGWGCIVASVVDWADNCSMVGWG